MTRPLTPAQRHLQRITAATLQRTAAEAAPDHRHANAYELQLMQLAEHRRQLKAIQSIERKVELKHKLLPLYDAWIDGSLAADHGAQDEVLTTLLVWHIDCASYPRALQIAEYALRHGLVLPDRYERSLACVLAEEIADAQLKAHDAGQLIELTTVHRAIELTDAHDMPDEVRAKLLKARGIARLGKGDGYAILTAALTDLRRAHVLHDKCGVKKLIEVTERKLKKITDTAAPQAATSAPSVPREPEAGGQGDSQNSTPAPTSTPPEA